MSKEQLLRARELIEAGDYRAARALLKKVDSPAARKLLARITELEARQRRASGGGVTWRDALHVLLAGIVLAALFTAIGVGLAYVINPAAIRLPAVSLAGGANPTPEAVAAVPTLTPLPTDIPCEAQAWWDGDRAAYAQTMTDVLDLSITRRPADIQAARDRFQAWRAAVEGAALAVCLAPVQEAVAAAAPHIEDYYAAYLTTTEAPIRAQRRLAVLESLLPLADALSRLGLTLAPEDSRWIERVQTFARADCPAERWYLEILVARNYLRYVDRLQTTNLQTLQPADAQTVLTDLRDLRSAWNTDRVAFPSCVQAASDAFLRSLDAFTNGVNAALNQDQVGALNNAQAARTAYGEFAVEVGRLTPGLPAEFALPR